MDDGAARPGGTGIINDEIASAFLGQPARAGDRAEESLVPGAGIETATAGAENEVALESIAAGLGADLAVVELDGEHRAAGVGFAAEFSTGRCDCAGGLDDRAVLDGEVDRAGRQHAAEGIDAGLFVRAENEQARRAARVDDAQ